jgi:hypothetical protein
VTTQGGSSRGLLVSKLKISQLASLAAFFFSPLFFWEKKSGTL